MKAIQTQLEKEKLLEQFKKSGKTQAQFAQENGLNVKTLSRWIYKWHHQTKTASEVKFVEIKTTAITPVNDIRVKKSGRLSSMLVLKNFLRPGQRRLE